MLLEADPATLGRMVSALAFMGITLTLAVGLNFIDHEKLGRVFCFQLICKGTEEPVLSEQS